MYCIFKFFFTHTHICILHTYFIIETGTTRVLTNMFEIVFDEKFATNAVHYDVEIEPTASKALYRKVFEEYRRKYFINRYPAFDGKKNAYSATELPYVHVSNM